MSELEKLAKYPHEINLSDYYGRCVNEARQAVGFNSSEENKSQVKDQKTLEACVG